jgi:UDP-N-acetylmuramyl pentapeptide phosphotransferase/UDP-N-acetylglucosamine-1-phosphate transferase
VTVLFGRLALAGAGAALARVLLSASPVREATSEATNYRGRPVSLAGGPTLSLAASLSASVGAGAEGRRGLAAASLVAGLGAGAVGYVDDMAGDRVKGLRGHLGALRRGRTTGGVAKLFGLTSVACAASALLGRRTLVDVVLGAGVIAGTANLVNLLDLRPGRALKAGLAIGVPLAASPVGGAIAGPVGVAAALMPSDLDERVMLGDCGANALGAVLGAALAQRLGRGGRAALLAGLGALTLASEHVSFTDVIDATPGLRELDRIGRRS